MNEEERDMKTGAQREAGRLLKLGRGTVAQDPESSEDPHDPPWGRKGKKGEESGCMSNSLH